MTYRIYFGNRAAAAATTVRVDMWLHRWRAPAAKALAASVVASSLIYSLAPPPAPPSVDKWQQPLSRAVPAPRLNVSQVIYALPPPAAAVSNLTTTLEWMQPWTGPPRYQPIKTYYQIAPPQPVVGVAVDEEGGPADEHERIACVPLALRLAIVPLLLRVVEVPLADRAQESNKYRDRSCGVPPVVPPTDGAFQEDTFDDDSFQV